MKVRIAFVTKPGTEEIDTDRVGSIEDHPTEDAKRLIKEGIAAEPTAAELEDWDVEVERRLAAEGGDLSSKTVKALRDEFPAAAAMPAGTKKDDLIAAVEEARRAEIAGEATTDDDSADGDDEPADDTTDADQ
jgi:hypothetical protein